MFFVVLACHMPVLDGFDQQLSFLHCPHSKQCTAVDKSKQHQEIPKKILGALRIEPGAAGREARMLSTVLCAPTSKRKQ